MPHSMKKSLFILVLSVVTFAMISCDEKSLSTPDINALYVFRTSQAGVVDTISLLDTLNIGDTVRLGLLLRGNFNYLTSFEAHATNTSCLDVTLDWNHELDDLLATGSDPEHAKLVFVAEKVWGVQTALKYVALKSGTHKIEMTIDSDAGEPYAPREYSFEIPVRDTPETPETPSEDGE